MSNVTRLIFAAMLLAVTGFCLFGYLATLEPGVRNVVAWRIGYVVFGAVSFTTAVRLAWRASALLRSK